CAGALRVTRPGRGGCSAQKCGRRARRQKDGASQEKPGTEMPGNRSKLRTSNRETRPTNFETPGGYRLFTSKPNRPAGALPPRESGSRHAPAVGDIVAPGTANDRDSLL